LAKSKRVQGLQQMVAFCREHGNAHEQCGKTVATASLAIGPEISEKVLTRLKLHGNNSG
jgi:hypothetical protein